MRAALSACLLAWGAAGCRAPEPEIDAALARARAHAAAQPAREWRSYLADRASTQSSPLTQIDRHNVGALEVAWRYDAGDLPARGGSQMQFNPLVVKGVLYGASPSLRLFALDAATGEPLWSFDPGVEVAPWTTSRGAVYWEDPERGDERILYGAGPYLHALDARSGRLVRGFGSGGRVDLREGLGREATDRMGVVLSTPGTLFGDLLIVGSRVGEGEGAAPGHVRAFDVRSGALRWIFHTIPQPGEPGHESWPPDAWQRAGGANAWAGISVDAERGLAFVPTGSATPDFFGGDRAGDDLFANSLLALDARSGERRWHFQVVRHDLWDRDLPAPPNLVSILRDGRRIPAVAQVTKTGDTFVFDRESGAPLFPLREEPVRGPAVPGEHPAAWQPLPVRPPPFVRQHFSPATVTARTPEVRAAVLSRIEGMRSGSLYAAPSLEGTLLQPGIDGGAEWGGAAWSAQAGLLFVNASEVPWLLRLLEAPASPGLSSELGTAYLYLCSGCHGTDLRGDGGLGPDLLRDDRPGFLDIYRVIRDGRGRMPGMASMLRWWETAAIAWWVRSADPEDVPAAWGAGAAAGGARDYISAGYHMLRDPEGLPASQPPWGTLTAIDLAAGAIRWQVPLGDLPRALALGLRGAGAPNYGGPVVTAGGLLFIAATPDAKLRAFDQRDGRLLWEAALPAAGFATPAVYEAAGRQFVAIAAGGGKLGAPSGSEYVAFALPRP